MNVRIHIDHIVLDGVALDASGATHMQAALEARLHELVVAHMLETSAAQPIRAARVEAPAIQLGAAIEPRALGRSIAASLHTGLTQPLASTTRGEGR